MFRNLNKKLKKSKKLKQFEHGLTVFVDVYVIIVLAYASMVMAGILPSLDLSRSVLVASLAVFAVVRLVVMASRSHTEMLK